MEKSSSPQICIIGAGFSGLCAAIQLRKQLGIDSFTIFDENHEVGGTWLVNQYPGCACDVPSHLYSFSFEPNPYWSKAYAGQKEIWEYLRNISKKHDLYPKIKFHHQVLQGEWDEKAGKWLVTTLDKQSGQKNRHVFDLVIGGVGALRAPNYPEQFYSFKGPKMHSAEWKHDIDITNKNVALVGSGASAVQIVPAIVDKVKKLTVYQRHAAWVVPRIQCDFPTVVQWAFAYVPGLQFALRNLIFWYADLTHSAFQTGTVLSRLSVKRGQFSLNKVQDPELKEKLTPTYKFGCKRVTPSNEFYPALARSHVTLNTSKITEVTKDTIVTEDGTREKPDVLILATGFKVQDFFSPLKIIGKGGQDILQVWKESGPSAYKGIACHLMPNAFFLLGPNTGLGHNSVVFSIECQVNWILQVIREMRYQNARVVTVQKSAEDEYMEQILTSLKSTVWGTTDCGSWYDDHRGINTTLWPESLVSYYNTTKNVDFSHLDFS